jgi:hypothetical protein
MSKEKSNSSQKLKKSAAGQVLAKSEGSFSSQSSHMFNMNSLITVKNRASLGATDRPVPSDMYKSAIDQTLDRLKRL